MKRLDYKLINEAFTREGWVMYHKLMAGNRYERGTDIVTWYLGHFKLNGKSVSDETICDMLKIDKRILEVNDAIAPHPMYSKYGQAFLAGVRWADEHPISKQDSNDATAPHSIYTKYGKAFHAGVRWGNEHPVSKQDSKQE